MCVSVGGEGVLEVWERRCVGVVSSLTSCLNAPIETVREREDLCEVCVCVCEVCVLCFTWLRKDDSADAAN